MRGANYKRFLTEGRVPYSVSEDEAHLNWDYYGLPLCTVMQVSSLLTDTVSLWQRKQICINSSYKCKIFTGDLA